MKLKESPVVFDQERHTYRLEDILLEGVTTLLRNQLFQNKYDGVPDFVLERAKDKGTLVHEQCELVDALGIEPVVLEAKNYKILKEEHGLKPIANEYLISDEVAFASSVDVIFDGESENDDEVYLADIKTTAKLDVDWLSWQLSIYAYMFEMQNPHLRVKKLYAIWLRNEVKELKEVQRIDNDTIQKLFDCEMKGEPFTSSEIPLPENGQIIPVEVFERAQTIISLDGKIKQLTEEKKRISEELYQYMEETGESKCEHELFIVSRVMPTTKKSLDAKGLEKCEPAIYKQFLKETAVKGSIRVTPRK